MFSQTRSDRPAQGLTWREDLFADCVVKALMEIDVRLVVAGGALLMTVAFAVGFAYAARGIRKEHQARFARIQERLERDANALVDRLLRRH